jgi:protein phosphatase
MVDRGEFSLETITLIYLLKIVYPSQIFVIRGNHEFEAICGTSSFFNEVATEYPQNPRVFSAFVQSFGYIPIAAVVDKLTICVHGGIGPMVDRIEAIYDIRRPIPNYSSPIVAALVWSDPCEQVPEFQLSRRGLGFRYGEVALLHFLDRSKAVRVIRGHECVKDGCLSLFDDRLVTVFSASNYCGLYQNDAAVLILRPSGEDELKTFKPIPFFARRAAARRRQADDPARTAAVAPIKDYRRPAIPVAKGIRGVRYATPTRTSMDAMPQEMGDDLTGSKKIGRQLSQPISWTEKKQFSNS